MFDVNIVCTSQILLRLGTPENSTSVKDVIVMVHYILGTGLYAPIEVSVPRKQLGLQNSRYGYH
jgi:hypothetical protein